MNNIDKEKINNSINEAYEKQSKKVKELLQSAKENLADQKECTYNYVTNKEKANQLYKISRVVTRKKQDENGIENKLEDKFNEMSEKIDISSKNLNFIFENVTQNNNNIMRKVDEITQNNEQLASKLVKAQLDAEKRMVEAQNNAFEKMMQKNNNSEDNSSEILEGQEKLKEEFDYILIDCPAGIEQGFKNAIAGASRAIVVTTAEISAIRDADRIIGLLEASEIKNPELVINRLRPNMVKKGEMMEVEDIVDLLSIDLIGVVPDDEFIITHNNIFVNRII